MAFKFSSILNLKKKSNVEAQMDHMNEISKGGQDDLSFMCCKNILKTPIYKLQTMFSEVYPYITHQTNQNMCVYLNTKFVMNVYLGNKSTQCVLSLYLLCVCFFY